jgi:hypothetical protein
MSSFYITLPAETRIYRSKDTVEQIYSGDWFSYTKEETRGYGKRVATFKTKRDLKLLNIASNQFYNDYVDRLNLHFKDYANTDNLRIIKLQYLFPLGFNNINYNDESNIHQILVKRIENKTNRDIIINDDIIKHTIFYNGRTRHSSKRADDEFSILLRQLYKEYDGFTSTVNLPSVFHNGFFRKELVIFNLDNLELESIEDIPQSGGINKSTDESTDESIYTKIIMPSEVSKEHFEKVFGTISNLTLQKDLIMDNTNKQNQSKKGDRLNESTDESIYTKIIMPSEVSKEHFEKVFGTISNLTLQKDMLLGNKYDTIKNQKQHGVKRVTKIQRRRN